MPIWYFARLGAVSIEAVKVMITDKYETMNPVCPLAICPQHRVEPVLGVLRKCHKSRHFASVSITCIVDHFWSLSSPFRNTFARLLFTVESEMWRCCWKLKENAYDISIVRGKSAI